MSVGSIHNGTISVAKRYQLTVEPITCLQPAECAYKFCCGSLLFKFVGGRRVEG